LSFLVFLFKNLYFVLTNSAKLLGSGLIEAFVLAGFVRLELHLLLRAFWLQSLFFGLVDEVKLLTGGCFSEFIKFI
jgi:hypothetical protein